MTDRAQLPLPTPPSFEYESVGPWIITHQYGPRTQTWVQWNLNAAIRRFWMLPDHDIMPGRRVCVDASGVTIMGHSTVAGASPLVVGTKEATNVVLRDMDTDAAAHVLWLVDQLQHHDGVAF